MMSIKVAIVGIGNCASALIQGVTFYKNVKDGDGVPGVMHTYFGNYKISDIEFVAAFEVNSGKIGKDLSEAIWESPNCCVKFSDVPNLDVNVQPGPIYDGVAAHMYESFRVSTNHKPVDVVETLKKSEAEILVNFLPVGSAEATRAYAQAALDAGCAFINCIPEFIASDPIWAKKFSDKGLPVAGDDIKSQLGATIVHRALVELFHERGLSIDSTYQLNIGGNTDFENMSAENRLASKRVSKTAAVQSLTPYDMPTRIGPSDYVSFLNDTKVCYIRIDSHSFGNLPIELDLKLKVNDSPNSAGIVIDLIRGVKLALDRKIAGSLDSISAYAFKHPPTQIEDHIARSWVEEFIEGKRNN
ncbi:inositol-3-phosphate synthase [Candidatus Bathyarchaeota archaeon]|nr:MAG: inositol-3-phosphate synthase [Candidatus Bathyarchaeota archaeon]